MVLRSLVVLGLLSPLVACGDDPAKPADTADAIGDAPDLSDLAEPGDGSEDAEADAPEVVVPEVDLAVRPEPGQVVAGIARKDADLVGGPKAEGQLGDLVLENHLATFLVEGVRPCGGYRAYGGALVDADLQPGGEDRMGEVWLIWNMLAFVPDEAEVVSDGRDGLAVVQIRGRTAPYAWITTLTGDLLIADPVDLDVTYEYRLAPDSKVVELIVTLDNDQATAADVALPVLASNFGDGSPAFSIGPGLDEVSAGTTLGWTGGVGLTRSYGFISAPDDAPSALFQATNVQISLLPAFVIPPGGTRQLRFHYVVDAGGTAAIEKARAELHGLETMTLAGTVDGDVGFVDEQAPSNTGGRSWVAITREADVLALAPIAADGTFEAVVPAGGPVVVQAFSPGRGFSEMLEVEAASDSLKIELPALGEVVVRVRDPNGEVIPAQVTFFREAGTSAPFGPGPVRFDADWGRSRSAVLYHTEEQARTHLLPGDYRVVASRGYSWELDEAVITVAPGVSQTLDLVLVKSVDDSGFVAADLHLHSFWSPDADVPYPSRLRQAAANDVALPVFTEHTYVGDVEGARAVAGVNAWVTPVPGQEVSTVEYGHFNAYPVEYDSTKPSGGAVYEHGWVGTGLFDQIRAQHDGDLIVQVNHPRISSPIQAYFNAIGLDSAALTQTRAERWTLDWDVLEVFNGRCQGDAGNAATLQDWFNLNDHGLAKALASGSDSHSEAAGIGHPRSWVQIDRQAVEDDASALVAPLRQRRSFVSCGPFVRFSGSAGEPMGATIKAVAGEVAFTVKVEAPSWMQVDTVRLLENGVPTQTIALATWERPDGLRAAVRYEGTLTAKPAADAWYVVEVLGSGNLWPIEPGDLPYAMTNPIEVDADADGTWTPPVQTKTTRAAAFRQVPKDLPQRAHRHDDVPEDVPLPARNQRGTHRHGHVQAHQH